MSYNLRNNVITLVLGCSIGAFVTAIYMKNKYERIIEEEIVSMRDMFERRTGVAGTKPQEDENGSEEKVLVLPKDRYKKIVRNYNQEIVEDEEYTTLEKLSHEANNYDSDRSPYVISIEQFSEENDHFDKSTIYFYEDDEVLADENEEMIDDVDAVVGKDALDCFGSDSYDPEVVYVRNERLGVDYEVIRLSKSYAETVGLRGSDIDE